MSAVQLPLDFDHLLARDRAMAQVAANAGEPFADRAYAFTLDYLKGGPATGEQITDAAIEAGIEPHDQRAFGPVLMRLSRDRLIEKCGTAVRRKGHGSGGAWVWRLKGERE